MCGSVHNLQYVGHAHSVCLSMSLTSQTFLMTWRRFRILGVLNRNEWLIGQFRVLYAGRGMVLFVHWVELRLAFYRYIVLMVHLWLNRFSFFPCRYSCSRWPWSEWRCHWWRGASSQGTCAIWHCPAVLKTSWSVSPISRSPTLYASSAASVSMCEWTFPRGFNFIKICKCIYT